MTLKISLVAMTLSCLPVMSFAMGCASQEKQAQSCAEGSAWDNELQSCVKQITS